MSAICSICGSDMTVQDREGTAFCLSCENRERVAAAVAAAAGPERDLADLERLAREYGETVRLGDLSIMPGWNPLRYFHPALGGRDCGGEGTRAEALALLREKGAKDAG